MTSNRRRALGGVSPLGSGDLPATEDWATYEETTLFPEGIDVVVVNGVVVIDDVRHAGHVGARPSLLLDGAG